MTPRNNYAFIKVHSHNTHLVLDGTAPTELPHKTRRQARAFRTKVVEDFKLAQKEHRQDRSTLHKQQPLKLNSIRVPRSMIPRATFPLSSTTFLAYTDWPPRDAALKGASP